jgi:hypothetical protein
MAKHGKQRQETGKGILKKLRVVKACLRRFALAAIMLLHNGHGIAVCLSTHGTRANTPHSSSGKQMSEKSQARIEYEEVNGSLSPEQVCDHNQRMRHFGRALRQQHEQRKNKCEWQMRVARWQPEIHNAMLGRKRGRKSFPPGVHRLRGGSTIDLEKELAYLREEVDILRKNDEEVGLSSPQIARARPPSLFHPPNYPPYYIPPPPTTFLHFLLSVSRCVRV